MKTPFEVVAKALEISIDLLNENSAIGETPNWDSLNHVVIIGELESNYCIQIPNKDIEKYTTMKAIIEFYNNIKDVSSTLASTLPKPQEPMLQGFDKECACPNARQTETV